MGERGEQRLWAHRDGLPDWYKKDVVALERPYLIVENLPVGVGELVNR